jgi:hypothetical protein
MQSLGDRGADYPTPRVRRGGGRLASSPPSSAPRSFRRIEAAGLGQITVADVVAFRNDLATKTVRRKRTLAAKTVNYILRDLDSVFAFAIKTRVASWNPASSVDRLKGGSEEQADGDDAHREDVAVTEGEVLSPTTAASSSMPRRRASTAPS